MGVNTKSDPVQKNESIIGWMGASLGDFAMKKFSCKKKVW